MDDFSVSILIPTDDDGFVLLRCPKCGEYFKLFSEDMQREEVLDIHCPQCGLISENYITDDVIELAQAKMEMVNFECCDCQAKICYLLKYCGCYCSYCGGQKDGSN